MCFVWLDRAGDAGSNSSVAALDREAQSLGTIQAAMAELTDRISITERRLQRWRAADAASKPLLATIVQQLQHSAHSLRQSIAV